MIEFMQQALKEGGPYAISAICLGAWLMERMDRQALSKALHAQTTGIVKANNEALGAVLVTLEVIKDRSER